MFELVIVIYGNSVSMLGGFIKKFINKSLIFRGSNAIRLNRKSKFVNCSSLPKLKNEPKRKQLYTKIPANPAIAGVRKLKAADTLFTTLLELLSSKAINSGAINATVEMQEFGLQPHCKAQLNPAKANNAY